MPRQFNAETGFVSSIKPGQNIDARITVTEAYKVMYLYLENLYRLTGSDDLTGFLGKLVRSN